MQHRTTFSCKPLRPRRQAGFTLVEIMIVVLIIGVLLNVATPSLVSARDKGQARSCVKNLSNFQTAKEQYALDNKIPASNTTDVTWGNISSYIKTYGTVSATTGPLCPTKGNTYNYNNLTTPPTCSYGGPVGNLHVVAN